MLFSSAEFLFLFLPLSLLGFHLARAYRGGRAAMAVTVAASLFFYGWWNPPYLLLILTSVGVNFFCTRSLVNKPARAKLYGALGVNLALLGYFKYRNFFLENVDSLISGGAGAPLYTEDHPNAFHHYVQVMIVGTEVSTRVVPIE